MQSMKAYKGSGGTPLILNLDTRWMRVVGLPLPWDKARGTHLIQIRAGTTARGSKQG